jgi:site-specific recombinase XerD
MIHKGAQFEVLSSKRLGLKQTYTTCVTQSKPLSTDVVWNMIHEGAQLEVARFETNSHNLRHTVETTVHRRGLEHDS